MTCLSAFPWLWEYKRSIKCYLSLCGNSIKNTSGMWAPRGRRSSARWQNSFWKAFLTHRSILTVCQCHSPLSSQGMRKYWTKKEKVWKTRIYALLYSVSVEEKIINKPLFCPNLVFQTISLFPHNNSSCPLLLSMTDQETGRPAS